MRPCDRAVLSRGIGTFLGVLGNGDCVYKANGGQDGLGEVGKCQEDTVVDQPTG